MKHCPPPEAIAHALADPDSAAAEILDHIAGCARCRSLLDSADPPVNWRLLADPEADQQDEPRAWFMNRLKTALHYTLTAPGDTDSGPSVPGYEVETEIARGGMGVVYRARDVALGRLVAIKVLRSDLHANPTQLSRFTGEAKALASLQHPNVVQLFQVGEADGQPYLVMEYVAGGTLRQAMRSGPWEATAAAQLVRTLADATAAVHRLGIIHRDLKPGNILLQVKSHQVESRNVEGGNSHDFTTLGRSDFTTPKVADFGLARFLESSERPTQTGEVFGTPEFMAPEQATGDQHGVGPETDVWALGVILYELLTGRVPFVGTTPIETMELVRRSPAVSPELVRPGVPRELAAVCLKCLEKLPYRRYHTAAALRDDLDQFLAGRPVTALPRSRLGRLLADIRRNPWVAIRWTLAVGLIAVLLGIIGWQQASTRSKATTSTAELVQLRELHDTTLRELYAARIALAEDAIDENRLMDAEKWLTLCRPTCDDPDERGWEWNYLSNRLRGPAQIELRLADASRHGFDDVNLIPNAEATSPDRRRRVVVGPTGRLMVYDREGRLLMQMPEVPGRTVGVRFSKDGRWLAIRTEDDTVVAFDGAAP